MGYIQELDAIQRFMKSAANLNSWRLQEAPVEVSRPVILWLPPNRQKDRHINRYLYVKRVSQYGTLYVNSLDQLGTLMDQLENSLEEKESLLPIFDGPNEVGILKAVSVEFQQAENLDVPIIVRYEASYARAKPPEIPGASSISTKIITTGGSG